MKKNLLIIATAALTMTACSNDETLEVNQGNAIAFRQAVNSRATQTTTATLTEFYVSAVNNGSAFMSNVAFSKGAGDIFTSTPEYRWPNGEVKFYAYAPSPVGLEVKEGGASFSFDDNATTLKLNKFTPNIDIAKQVDFISSTATAQETKEENVTKSVALEFTHNLAQIEIKAKNTNANYTYSVMGVKIARVASEGVFTFGSKDWSLTANETQSYNVFYASAIDINANERSLMTNASGNAMLLPQQLEKWEMPEGNDNGKSYIAVLVNIKTANGDQTYPSKDGMYNWLGVGINDKWEAGKHYTYVLDFTNGAGSVTPDHKNGDIDPNDVDPNNPGEDPKGEEPGEDDPFKPGQELLGGPITFTATVTEWTNTGSSNL